MILSNLTVPLLGLVDTAVVGHLGSPQSLGAVAVGAHLAHGVTVAAVGDITAIGTTAVGTVEPGSALYS